MAGKTTLLAKPQRTHSQHSSKTAADRVTRKLVHSARASSRQGTSALPAAAIAAASALKQASASGKLGCPKCRQAVYGCKKCRAAYVKTTGVSIPVDRSLHAGVFNGLQHQSASTHSTALTGQLVAGQKPSSAHTDGSGLQGKAGQSTGKATPADKGEAVVAVAPKGHKGIADRGRPLASGRRASADRETPSHDRQGSAKRARSESPVPQPARKKQKPSSLSAVTAAAAASMGARVCGKVAPGTRRSRSAVSPGVSKAHADSDPPQAAERSRLSQNPKAPPAAKQAPDSKASTAAKGPASKLSTAAKACTVSGSKPSSSAKGARPSSSSGRAGLATVKQHGKAGRLSVPSALARSASKHQCVSAKPRVAALPKQAAPTPTQVHKPTTLLPRSHTRGLSPFIKKAPTSAPAPALPKQAAATAPAKSTVRSVGAPKAMPAAKIRRSPSSTAAATAGSVLGRGLDSNLGCSKCRFVPSGCKRCRAKQAGRLSLGTNA